MKIDELIHVSGLPGLYKIGASKSNGIIIEDIDSGKSRFASMRKHQFTPLGTVAIYTMDDAEELTKVFDTIEAKSEEYPIPSLKSSSDILFAYFKNILPNYDEDRVLISDVKKVIKWYTFLKGRSLYPFEISSEEEE